ncbi:MFS transporter [Escherichia coli]
MSNCCAHFRRTPDRRLCSRRHWLRHYSTYARHATDAVYGGNNGGSALLGLFLGSLVLGWISDHIGRQKIFTFSFLLITLASFLQFFTTTQRASYWAAHFDRHWSKGGDYSVGHTLLAEFSPRRHRGILLGAFSVVWTVGYVLASIAGHHFTSENPEAWRWLLASAALPALLITLLRWGTPESPRWLLRQGRLQKLTLSCIAILVPMFYWAMKW